MIWVIWKLPLGFSTVPSLCFLCDGTVQIRCFLQKCITSWDWAVPSSAQAGFKLILLPINPTNWVGVGLSWAELGKMVNKNISLIIIELLSEVGVLIFSWKTKQKYSVKSMLFSFLSIQLSCLTDSKKEMHISGQTAKRRRWKKAKNPALRVFVALHSLPLQC